MLKFVMLGIILLACHHTSLAEVLTQPEQIHISYGVAPTEMVVTWVTMDPTSSSIVEYGEHNLNKSAKGSSTKFVDGGSEKRVFYIHRVVIKNLSPGTLYRYHCGSNEGWSSLYFFSTMRKGNKWSPRFAVFGDLGNVNAQSLPRLQEETQRGMYDVILHVGDFAYDMDTDNARVGDEFMKQLEPIAAYVPYMTCVGNHEQAYNFSNYVNRFSMVEKTGKINNNFFSTSEASKPENRAQRPWIITMGHRPMYCSSDDGDDCTHKESIIRKGIPVIHAFGLEDLFYKYGVDIEIWAHEHVYERLWPVYDRKVYNGSFAEPYTNPKAPVHIITGSAGCQERHDPFVANPPPWSAFRNADYGYTRMQVINNTHLSLEQVSDDKGGEVIDKIMVIKEKHGPESWM
ncbi:acid phosphatase type 7-like [Limulus polyphemus]|uniref:Purple acid phosphatase n=1 Tax=Limulus polyphemus TaxID=6850 RepID=A0ABM1B175_LIMPO|nr:acid phosphatase type 7-like [Limulus polyphemus]